MLCAHALLRENPPFFMDHEWYDPSPSQGATVTFGNARFTMLTPLLARLECSLIQTFDDRASFVVLNRNLPVPKYFVSYPSSNSIKIDGDLITIQYTKDTPHSSCTSTKSGFDQTGGTRVPKYPDGYSAADQADCCTTCDKITECNAWVYDPSTKKPNVNCWLMMGSIRAVRAPNRVFGQVTAFCNGNLTINYGDKKSSLWTPSITPSGNLNGTIDAADCYTNPTDCLTNNYPTRMQQGLLSKDGWSLIDDSNTARYVTTPQVGSKSSYPWFDTKQIDSQDWYIFLYDRNYRVLLGDYQKIAGRMTLPPHNAFGVWWSRYYPYSQDQFVNEVLQGYASNGLPLNIAVLDMDWHIEPREKGCDLWGGFTWNTQLFPDPIKFLKWIKSANNTIGHPLQVSLNVHPQTGVDHCQEYYAEFAKAMGKDPSTNETIRSDMGNRTFVDNLFRIYYDSQKLELVDYWWTDYGGSGGPYGKELFWSNYVYDSHLQESRNQRPLVLSRYGGLGNHRYPIGFSGDTFQSFSTLQWEIQMTQTAANVMFGYWSHDIGGFHDGHDCPGDHDPKNTTGSEMLMRWIQFGAVSPIFRTHCDHCERRIWLFPYFDIMKDAMLLRNALVPYIYTQARLAYDTGVSVVHPLYYDLPDDENAYQYREQYMFGNVILAAPISAPVENKTGTIKWPVWLGGTSFINWNGTKVYDMNQHVEEVYSRADIPLFVRTGHIIPMRTMASVNAVISDPLMWVMFVPGANVGKGSVYEDDGNSLSYKTGNYATTDLIYQVAQDRIVIRIGPPVGPYVESLPSTRAHVLQLRGITSKILKITANSQDIHAGRGTPGYYINERHSLTATLGALIINLPRNNINTAINIDIVFSA
jgi:alpha-glucosidase (family GH31 glycosyl hydrolase)